MTDVVDTLLDLEEGEQVRLEAANYEWASPFEVDAIATETFAAPSGAVWNARRITVDSTDRRGSSRELNVYPDGPAPHIGPGYGRLVAAEVIEEGEDQDDEEEIDIDLPDGVTRDNVEAAADEHEYLGDAADAIGVTRGRMRTITVALGCYGDVKDLPAGGRT